MKPGPLLSRVPLFATLSPDELGRLSSALEMRSEPAGSLIMQEGLPGDEVIFLLEGQAEVIKAYGGEGERRLGIHGPGTVFGEMSLFSTEGLHTATVKAITPLLLCSLSQAGFEELLLRHPAVSLEMLHIMSRRLQTSDNETVIDLTEKNRQLAQTLGDLQAAQVQLVEKEKLEHELDLACQIQQSVLPRELPSLEGTELGAIMEPARAVGGDFYGLWRLADDRLALVVGDVSDKGMPAALGMALSYSMIRSEGTRPDCARPDGGPEPAEVFEIVNRQLVRYGRDGIFRDRALRGVRTADRQVQLCPGGAPGAGSSRPGWTQHTRSPPAWPAAGSLRHNAARRSGLDLACWGGHAGLFRWRHGGGQSAGGRVRSGEPGSSPAAQPGCQPA